jgi:hypothetical protein
VLTKHDVPDENKVEIKDDLVLMAKRWGEFKTKGEDEEDRYLAKNCMIIGFKFRPHFHKFLF